MRCHIVNGDLLPCLVAKVRLGFTLIELLVVMAVIAVLLTLAMPRFFNSIDKSKEAALIYDLSVMRDAIDKYYGDRDEYPASLDVLVEKKYLKKVPIDPITDSTTTWVVIPSKASSKNDVYDVKSGSTTVSSKGDAYSEW